MKSFDPVHSVRRWARSSPWLVMSVLIHLIVLVGLGLVVIRHGKGRRAETSGFITVVRPHDLPDAEPIGPEPLIVRSAIPPDLPGTLAPPDEYVSTFADAPIPDDPVADPGLPDGAEGGDLGGPVSSTGIGVGPGGRRGPGVTAFPNRIPGPGSGIPPKGSSDRRLRTDAAVLEGLRWLVRHQNPDGSWGARALKERCAAETPCFDPQASLTDHYDEGLTGLALLCFLGAGFGHDSRQYIVDPVQARRHRIGEVVKKGLEWLKRRQNPDGSFSRDRTFMYDEALATMALSEAYGLTRKRYWGEPAQKAVDFLQRAQRPNPSGQGLWGWRYASRQEVEDFRGSTGNPGFERELYDSDTSVTTWCVMALKSAQISGLSVEPAALDGAMEFCRFATASDGLVGYLDAKGAGQVVTGPNDHFTYHAGTMSALGMCIRIFAKHDPSDPFLELAARRIVQDLPAVSKDRLSVDYYYWYYASIALNQLDGEGSPRRTGRYWNPWNRAMVEAVLALQDKTERACTCGGWITGDRWSYAGGPVYSTAINVLTLEVYYRYENAFGGVKRY